MTLTTLIETFTDVSLKSYLNEMVQLHKLHDWKIPPTISDFFAQLTQEEALQFEKFITFREALSHFSTYKAEMQAHLAAFRQKVVEIDAQVRGHLDKKLDALGTLIEPMLTDPAYTTVAPTLITLHELLQRRPRERPELIRLLTELNDQAKETTTKPDAKEKESLQDKATKLAQNAKEKLTEKTSSLLRVLSDENVLERMREAARDATSPRIKPASPPPEPETLPPLPPQFTEINFSHLIERIQIYHRFHFDMHDKFDQLEETLVATQPATLAFYPFITAVDELHTELQRFNIPDAYKASLKEHHTLLSQTHQASVANDILLMLFWHVLANKFIASHYDWMPFVNTVEVAAPVVATVAPVSDNNLAMAIVEFQLAWQKKIAEVLNQVGTLKLQEMTDLYVSTTRTSKTILPPCKDTIDKLRLNVLLRINTAINKFLAANQTIASPELKAKYQRIIAEAETHLVNYFNEKANAVITEITDALQNKELEELKTKNEQLYKEAEDHRAEVNRLKSSRGTAALFAGSQRPASYLRSRDKLITHEAQQMLDHQLRHYIQHRLPGCIGQPFRNKRLSLFKRLLAEAFKDILSHSPYDNENVIHFLNAASFLNLAIEELAAEKQSAYLQFRPNDRTIKDLFTAIIFEWSTLSHARTTSNPPNLAMVILPDANDEAAKAITEALSKKMEQFYDRIGTPHEAYGKKYHFHRSSGLSKLIRQMKQTVRDQLGENKANLDVNLYTSLRN